MAIFKVDDLAGHEAAFPIEFRVDEDWYVRQYASARLAIENQLYKDAADHYRQIGARRAHGPCPYFSPRFVEQQIARLGKSGHDDVRTAFIAMAAGSALSPHWLFDELFFLRHFPQVRDALEKRNLICSFFHYIRNCDQRKVRPSALFDPDVYLAQDGAIQSDRPFSAFVSEHARSEIRTSNLFDPEFYAAANPDISAHIGPGKHYVSGLHHFAETGIFEGRVCIPDFDRDYYLRTYPDIRDASEAKRASPMEHFLRFGILEMRNPNKYFDAQYYIERQPSVPEEVSQLGLTGPFEHFLAVGSKRGYRASQPLISLAIEEEAGKALFEKRAKISAQNLFRFERKLRFPVHEEVDVSCIVPVFNKAEMTAHFLTQLRGIAGDADGPRIEVIVVDNGSTDRTASIDEWTENLVVIRTDRPLGYTKACNLGAAAARGRQLLFLNNDMEIAPDAIANAFETAQEKNVGAVGGRIILTNGILQEAGSIAWRDGSTLGYGRGESPTDGRYLFKRDVDFCSGCFLMVRREIFEELDGFSEDFSPGYYEETDLCARIWDRGDRVIYDPSVLVTHYEYASYSSGRPPSVSRAIMARHRQFFVDRNPSFLAGQRSPNLRNVIEASSRSGRPNQVLIFDDLLPDPRFGSGFVRSNTLVQAFNELGWRITTWAHEERASDIEEELEDLGITTIVASRTKRRLSTYLATQGADVDLIWTCRTHNFAHVRSETMAWRQQNPQGRIVADTEAIAALRELEVETIAGHADDGLARNLVRNELSATEAMDAVVTVNEIDLNAARGAIAKPLYILGHTLSVTPTSRGFEDRQGFLFCGAIHEAESPNLDSLLWYVREVHPLVRQALPGAVLSVVGYWRSTVPIPDALASAEGVEFVGGVDDLSPYFDSARVFVAPTRFAGGVPHKVHQSMALGLPAVVTPLLRTQLVEPGQSANDVPVLAPETLDARMFADCCAELYQDETKWTKLRGDALDYMRQHCSAEQFSKALGGILEDLGFHDRTPDA